ncbi:hypothetical protein LCGC14_1054940 [marine sediment metagenome]|uniref:Uncharacterized protein n=1 Tax=marine sediment metagenome TaxID=412755 RepID=A0A0F9MS99_9ZZZZ
MATIDLTVARSRDVAGVRRRIVGQYTGPASYVAGGDALLATELGLGTIEFLSFENAVNATPVNRLLTYDHANEKVVWVIPNTGAEVAGAVDLSGFSARFEAIGL